MPDLIRLISGDTEVTLAPAIGGGIAAFRWRGRNIMRAATPEMLAAGDPLGLAAFPLVPFSNRIAHGRFVWERRTVQLPLNFGDHPHAIHGFGWQAPWRVEAADAVSARLGYDYHGGAWPWPFAARQDFAVADDGFTLTLSVTNLGDTPMPSGLGLHPYWPNPAETRLQTVAQGWFATDAFVMPLAQIDATASDLSAWLHRAKTTDHVFHGCDGRLTLGWPTHSVEMTAGPRADWMVVYAPADDTICAVEPVTHPTDALNDPKRPGIHILAPGETQALTIRYRVRPSDTSA